MKSLMILAVATAMLAVAACSTSRGIKEEIIDENGNVLKWADCYAAIQDYIGDKKLYDRLFAICAAQDAAGYEEWKSKIASKIRKSR
jgi:hypothetical protein